MAKEVNLVGGDGTLLGLEVELPLMQAMHEFLQEDHVFFKGFCVDGNIINIHIESFSNHIFKDFIHSSLEGCWGIAESEWHSGEFVIPL